VPALASTPIRTLLADPGSGLACCRHALPFQCSMRVWNAPAAGVVAHRPGVAGREHGDAEEVIGGDLRIGARRANYGTVTRHSYRHLWLGKNSG